MKKLTIALLSGGISSERDVSLKSGEQVFNALDKQKYDVLCYDPKTDLGRLLTDAPKIDAALIILHGTYGEDGTVQGLLDLIGIPYQGTGVLGSAIAMNKLISKQLYENAGLLVPPYLSLKRRERPNLNSIISKLGLPIVVKPVSGGSSIGMSVVRAEKDLPAALDKGFAYDDTLLLEAYIKGTELTGGVIGNDDLTALPIVEIIPGQDYDFFDYHAKYTQGASSEICPARIAPHLTLKAQNGAKSAHQTLCCKGYSRTDMILKDQDIYVLETNTIPGMTQTSLLPLAAKAAGISFAQLLDKLIALSLENRK